MEKTQIYYSTRYSSPLGVITLECDDSGNLVGLWLCSQKNPDGHIAGNIVRKDDVPVFALVKRWLDGYFAGRKPAISKLP